MSTRKFKSVCTSLLAFALAFTQVVPAFAALDSNAAGSSGQSATTVSGGDFGVNLDGGRSRIGFRVSLVDGDNPSNVISVNSSGEPMVVDYLYATEDMFNYYTGRNGGAGVATALKADNLYTSVKTQPLSSFANGNDVQWVFLGDQDYFKPDNVVPWSIYTNNTYYSKGEDFVNWCKSNSSGSRVVGDDGNLLYSVSLNGKAVPLNSESFLSTIDVTGNGNNSSVFKSSVSMEVEVSSWANTLSEIDSACKSLPTVSAEAAVRLYLDSATMLEGSSLNKLASSQDIQSARSKLDSVYQSLKATSLGLSAAESKVYESFVKGSDAEPVTNKDVITSYSSSGETNNSAGDNEEEDAATIWRILKSKDSSGTYLFRTAAMLSDSSLTLEDEFNNRSIYVLVEPLFYLTIFPYGNDNSVLHPKMYGTITNFVQAFNSDPVLSPVSSKRTFNWKFINQVAWSALHTSGNFEFKGSDGESVTYTLSDVTSHLGKEMSFSQLNALNPTTAGYGVNVYWGKDFNKIPVSYGSNTLNPKDSQVRLVKFYTLQQADSTGKVVAESTVDVKHKTLQRKFGLVNEPVEASDDGIWQLVCWATGTDPALIPAQGDLSHNFEYYAAQAKSSNQLTGGSTPTVIDLNHPKAKDVKTVYIKLVYMPVISTGSGLTVIKVLEDEGTGDVRVLQSSLSSVPSVLSAESKTEDYSYKEFIQTPDAPVQVTGWSSINPSQSFHGTEPSISITSNTKTVYLHYIRRTEPAASAHQITLDEDEISYGYTLLPLSKTGRLAYIQEYFDSRVHAFSCDGHEYYCSSDECSGHTAYCHDAHIGSRYNHISDNRFKLALTSSNQHPDFITDYKQVGSTWSLSGTKTLAGGSTPTLKPDASFLLTRHRTRDAVTLYPGKNDQAALSVASHFGITQESYIPARTRAAQEGSGSLLETFTTNFSEAADHDRTLSWCYEGVGSHGSCSAGSNNTWDSTPVGNYTVSELNATYSNENNVLEKYYLGSHNEGTEAPSQGVIDKDFIAAFANNASSQFSQDGQIAFYPYVRMQASTSADNSTKQTINVTSENLSVISAFTRIEAGVWKNGSVDSSTKDGSGNPVPNVNLTSTQWSTHASSIEFMASNGVADKKSVLPGGAIYDLDFNKSAPAQNGTSTGAWKGDPNDKPQTSTRLGYRVYQVCVDDSLQSALDPASNAPLLSEAQAQITALDQSIRSEITSYGLVQIVAKGMVPYKGYLKNFITKSKPSAVYSGASWNGITLSTAEKYYLKLVQPGTAQHTPLAQIANLGVYDGGVKSQHVYRVYSDTDGNVMVSRDGAEIARISKTQGVSELLSNPEVARVDAATKAVTNYVKAIDRNMGSNRKGEAWYNEAFDGIAILQTEISYDVSFGDTLGDNLKNREAGQTALRTAVLDTYLCGKADSKGDLYNFSSETMNSKLRSSMFITGRVQDSKVTLPAKGGIGTMKLKSGSSLPVAFSDIMTLCYTKVFYIPNATVSDLS